MATLEALRRAILPGARWLAEGPEQPGSPARDRQLAWVRLMRARVPAFDALEAGDVAIVPLAALAIVSAEDDGVAALVRAAADARIAGVITVADSAGTTSAILAGLIRTAATSGVPVLDAGPVDAAAIERSAIGYLVNERGELDRQATLLESRLEHVALSGGGPDGFAAAIAGFFGRAVAIEGRRGITLAVHAPPDVPGAAAAVAAYHRRPRGAAIRIPLPLPGRGDGNGRAGVGGAAARDARAPAGAADASGALVLLGDPPATELERVATGRIAGLVALELARDEAVGQAIETARSEPLPADGPPWVVIVARQAIPGDAADARAREAVRRDVRGLAPARRMALRGDVQSVELRVVAAAPDRDADGLELAGRIARLLGRTVAVSRPFLVPGGRSAAEADARATLEAAERLAEPPPVARADRLPAYRLLGNLHNVPDGERHARALLEPLLTGRPDVQRERLATLRAVLDQPGLAEAAAALGVHRNTIAYRIRGIEGATGWRLADPELRFPLALALRLVQDDQL